MKSIARQVKQKLEMNKKGQIIDTATGVMVSIFVFLLIVFAILLGISSLNPGSFFTAGSAEQNATNQIRANTTATASNFSNQLPTVGTILGVVLILGALSILILIVLRFRSNTGGGTGGL